ncbi:MAG TPA: hypothetical protein RMF84_18140, partial [Polyangiaceae bacterium LLY-WYZ-14_1]|nr:hypothetical protein [Polyangiaceae bacterium LLY-WYZ-14_1]
MPWAVSITTRGGGGGWLAPRPDLVEEGEPIHARHAEVCQHDRKGRPRRLRLPQHLEGRFPTGDRHHLDAGV